MNDDYDRAGLFISGEAMVVVHVITRMIRGGADENTLLSCNAQAAQGYMVHLIYGNEASEDMLRRVDPRVALHQVRSLVHPISFLNDLVAIFELAKIFRALHADIVHTHTSKAGIVGRIAAWIVGTKGVVHGVHILPFLNVGPISKMVYLLAERASALVTDEFVSVSSGMRDICLQYGIGNEGNHHVVPSGMDIRAFLTARPLGDDELFKVIPYCEGEGARIILMVAALEPRKRVVEFLDVFSHVTMTHGDAKLVILGEGADRARIETEVGKLGLSNKVYLAGFRTDVERWIARADICVLASEREGLPRAVVQYAAGACPCVVTNLPGVDVVVKHAETGYLVDCDKIGDMVGPIVQILNDSELAKSMRENARALNLLPWGVDNMTNSLDRIYRRLIGLKG